MTYPSNLFFDIETLVNVAQPRRILLLGDISADFLEDYVQQKSLLNQPCSLTHIQSTEINTLWSEKMAFDVAIVINLFEHIDKTKGMQVLSRLRDVLSPQYCLALPLSPRSEEQHWSVIDLFSFALSKVATYQVDELKYGLFKYDISDYKKTPDWLNADNWANPQMWGKYWW